MNTRLDDLISIISERSVVKNNFVEMFRLKYKFHTYYYSYGGFMWINFYNPITNCVGSYYGYFVIDGVIYKKIFYTDKKTCIPFSEFIEKYTNIDSDDLIIDLQRIIIESI